MVQNLEEGRGFDLQSNRLKIACIYSSSLNDWHGPAAALNNMLHIFKGLGIRTDLISYSVHSDKFNIKQKNINPQLNSTAIHIPLRLPNFIKVFSIFIAIRYAWKPVNKCDIVFADAGILSMVPAIILGRLFGKPIVLHYTDQMLHNLPECVWSYIVKQADLILAISHYLMDKTKSYNCKSIIYFPSFVDVDLFNLDLNARRKIREYLKIEENCIVIGYAGSFGYGEGIPNLLLAFRNLLNHRSNIKMVLMGRKEAKSDDDIQALVKELNIEDSVTIVPPRPHEEVPNFLSACDITCCPKIDCEINRAANPIKVPEYLSMGLPTVCSAVGGITDTIEDGVDGLLVKPGDVKELEKKLEWVILNPEHSREIGEKGRKKAIEKHSYNSLENMIKQSIQEIMAMKRGNKRI